MNPALESDPGDVLPPSRVLLPRLAAAAFLAACVVGFAALRVQAALDDPNFDVARPTGLLRSDPAVLFWITQGIVEAGGTAPEGFRSDPLLQHPTVTDLPAELTVGLEFLVARAHLVAVALGAPDGASGLVRTALWTTSLLAVSACLAVFAIVRTRTGSRRWAAAATLLFLALPANHRTVAFVLVREDLAFPLFALHLAALVLALERPSPARFLASGLFAAAALATWHASGFLLGLELAFLLALQLRRDASSPAPAHVVLLVGPSVVGALLVPALRHQAVLLSPTLGLGYALLALAMLRHRGASSRTARAMAGAAFAATLVLGAGARSSMGWGRGYDHVWEMLLAKLVHGGRLPVDPNELSFDTRLLWQGPFETLSAAGLWHAFGLAWLGLGAALVLGFGRGGPRSARPYLVAACLALPLAWAVGRLTILAGLLVPIAVGVTLGAVSSPGSRARRWAALALGLLLVPQGVGFLRGLGASPNAWYLPPGKEPELEALVAWVTENLAPGTPVLTDFLNGPALLAHAGVAIALQPKYETDEARRRAQRFLETYFHGTPDALHELARRELACEYLLVDRYTLGWLSRYAGGLPVGDDAVPAGSPAAVFQSREEAVLRGVPGYELVYRSPSSILQSNGEPYDLYRLYRLTEERER